MRWKSLCRNFHPAILKSAGAFQIWWRGGNDREGSDHFYDARAVFLMISSKVTHGHLVDFYLYHHHWCYIRYCCTIIYELLHAFLLDDVYAIFCHLIMCRVLSRSFCLNNRNVFFCIFIRNIVVITLVDFIVNGIYKSKFHILSLLSGMHCKVSWWSPFISWSWPINFVVLVIIKLVHYISKIAGCSEEEGEWINMWGGDNG